MEKYFNISVIAHEFFYKWSQLKVIQLLFTTVQNESQKTKTCIIIKTKSLHILFTLIFVKLGGYSLSINGKSNTQELTGSCDKKHL